MMFELLPDRVWHEVWIGAALMALLFTIGRLSIGLYVGNSGVGFAEGAAGSLAILEACRLGAGLRIR